MVNSSIHHALGNESSVDTPNKGVWRTHMAGLWGTHVPGDWHSPHSCTWDTSRVHPMFLCILLFICIVYNILYNKPIIVSKLSPWVLWAMRANFKPQEESWESCVCSQVGQTCGKPGTLNLQLAYEVGAVLWEWALNLWGLANSG